MSNNSNERDEALDRDIKETMGRDMEDVPKAGGELRERLKENTAASPADSGGDIDADWEEVNTSGAEAVFGHNPTPDQSDVEENAAAMGLQYQDNEPLDLLSKMNRRDENRFELEENSKGSDDMI